MENPTPHRCGTVAIIGRPNVGKSTLLNKLLGQKIAIVSKKPETTRDRILGILTIQGAQILFLDTPGIYRGPRTVLAQYQIQSAREALESAELLLLMTEAPAGLTDEDKRIIASLPKELPAFLVINKQDRVQKTLVLPQIAEASQLHPFKEIFPASAAKGENLPELLKTLVKYLPEGPPHYPEDQVTDKSTRDLVQELIREKTLVFTHEEVPHGIAVMVEEYRAGKSPEPKGKTEDHQQEAPPAKPRTYIRALIYVERESQKGILIGKGGQLMKMIGESARKEIGELVQGEVFLDLWVKVAKNWRKDEHMLKRFGYSA